MKYYYQVEGDLRNNIGDVLQGMVAKPFLPSSASVVDREALSDIDPTEPGVLLANGWYMHSFDKFPPPRNVTPIYVSVHVANSKLLTDPKVRQHFKENSPIGCRDTKTLKLFLGWGIPAYYSGCLTITTKARAPINASGSGEVLLVDNVDHPIPQNVQDKLERLLGTKLVRVSHDPPTTDGSFLTYVEGSEKHMDYLLERYCNAALIITTKIHCALPCLGMNANVMLVHPNPADPRLATVNEFLDIISYNDILNANEIVKPIVRGRSLQERKVFITEIVKKSIAIGDNIIKRPDTLHFKKIRLKSIVDAKIYRLAVLLMRRLGIKKAQIEKVYGAGF